MMNTMLGNINNHLVIYLIIINCIGFICMFLDKRFARMNQYRISERTLFSISIIGGILGVIFGMYCFRHKTKKLYFVIGLPIILIIQIIFWVYFTRFI